MDVGAGSGVGVGVGVGVGWGWYGPMDGELRQPLHWSLSLPARTPTMYDLPLSALNVRLLVGMFRWLLTGACQLPPPSVL